ncbi:MAG TPA: MFS transporter [Caulobacteraceae bacterium]|nr:MFS transporter [Caulobacteraceae bacterium]
MVPEGRRGRGEVAIEAKAPSARDYSVAPVTLIAPGRRLEILAWAGALLFLGTIASPGFGVITLPVTFFLKNKLHLAAHQTAAFNLWTGLPLYFAFGFGLARDRWSPLRRGDRGHLVLFGAVSAAIFAGMAFAPPTYWVLLLGILLVTAALMMVASAMNGLVSAIGRQHVMAGQASVAILLANAVPTVASYLLGGQLSQLLEGERAAAAARALFLVAAAIMAAIAILAAVGPRTLFGAARTELSSATSVLADVRRLLRWRPTWPALIIQLLWQFGPALGLAMQYHMANELHASDAEVGDFYAIFFACLIPTYGLYAWLCQRVRLSKLLWWGAATSVPQMAPLLLVHSATSALWAAVPVGLMGGFATAAIIDLTIRSCPEGLAGTMMMLVTTSGYWVAVRFGDVWGTDLYDHHGGFATAVWATIAVYALILPMLLLVPKRLLSTSDGQLAA